jgi:DNA-binding MarR family transcriptional regulator
MPEDVVRTLGFLTLGTRMKRIGERLQADTQDLLDEMHISFVPSQYPFLAAIDRLGPLTVGELAEAVGVTQPATTKSIGLIARLGLLRVAASDEDQRRKIVSLTERGQKLVDGAKKDVWPHIERAVADLCAGLDGPLLEQLAAIEDGLAAKPLVRRIARTTKKGAAR